MSTPSAFARRLADIAWSQHEAYHLIDESDPPLSRQIARYWSDLGLDFPGVATAWSAVFVSWCVMRAGATAQQFAFSPQHSVYMHRAIRDAEAGVGAFHGRRLSEYAPGVGDIVQNNRGGARRDFDYARRHASYASHCAIVVERGVDAKGNYLLTVGGNESDSIRRKVIRLDARGRIRQRAENPFIGVIQTLL